MSENYIHIDNITENKVSRPGEIGIGASVQVQVNDVSKFAIIAVLSSLLKDLEVKPMDITAYRMYIEENVVRVDRTQMEVAEIREALARYRRLKAEMEGEE